MFKYNDFDFLCNEPFFVNGIGYLKCPTLREIRLKTYNVFAMCVNIINMTLEDYLKAAGLTDRYEELSDDQKEQNTMFNIMLYGDKEILLNTLSLFLRGAYEIDESTCAIHIYDDDGAYVGEINNDNFQKFRDSVKLILGITKKEEVAPKFKNKLAEKLYKKIKSGEKKQKKESDENYSLDNMIKKYCTHNKVGINILNVWDLTYYQFTTMFAEYQNGRQCDFNDMIAANSFNYNKTSDYKPMDYMEKINN